jgi:translocation and assembly module TamB
MINKKLLRLKWLIKTLLISAVLVSGYLLINTEKGLETILLVGKQFLPGQLKIHAIHGRLLGPIQLKEFYYKNNKINLSISEIQFDWNWHDLLLGKLNLHSIFIDKLNIFIKQKTISISKKSKTIREKIFQIQKIFHFLKFNSIIIHQINIRSENINLKLQGSIQQQWHINWELNIKKLTHLIPNLQSKVAFQGTINGAFKQPEFNLIFKETNLQWKKWKFQKTQATLNINTKDKKWLFDLSATQLDNKLFKFYPFKLKLSGSLLPFSLHGILSGFKLKKILSDGQLTNILFPTTQIKSTISKYGLEASLRLFIENKNQLIAYLFLPKYQVYSELTPKQPIRADIDLRLKNLSFLTQLLPDLKKTKGIFNAQLKISGSLNKPLFNLNINLQQASTDISTLGLNLKKIKCQLHTNENTLLGIGQVYSGNGSIEFHTASDLLKPYLPTTIDIQGKDVTIIHNSEYQITASPKLKIQANLQKIKIEGSILFPKAKINPKNNNLADLSEDVQFVGENKKNLTFPFILKNDIKIEMGDDIQLKYKGLSTKLTGSLIIKHESDHPILATGQLKFFRGGYNYFAQSLKLTSDSTLNFANSPINNPTINITASRNILIMPISATSRSIPTPAEIGLHIKGTLQNPQITLFVKPSNIIKSQLDILSYLITGQASYQLSAESTQLLLSAVSNLGNENNVGQLINKFQKKIGLDQLTIGAKPIFNTRTNNFQQNISLIIGKNLSPKLNLSYSFGLLDQINILEINYILNKNFSLKTTRSDFANSLDLFYKLEKN